ncbi:serine/threonine-protein phosphatase 7 long form homolog [Arachis hypogaea]|uniref:serine/threonine-protein phosphatase 7 long form homolog n=1 Tax=Arachis hypogaea TaxID=3818 RepID=UPI003B21FAFB
MINALIERWRPETHTFHFPVGECAVTLEDVAMILGLPTNGLPVTEPTMSCFEALEAECLHQFGVAPRKTECRGSFIKLTWFRGLRDRIVLNNVEHIQMYVKCHIMLLFGTVMFGDKASSAVHWKFLPLLRNFHQIIQFSWGSACLAHLYRSLCRATRVDCKKMDGPLVLLLTWAWIRLPFLAPIPGNPRVFPIANRRLLDDLQEGRAYGIGNIDPDMIPLDIHHNSVIWSDIVPLISFECIEWHASDRVRRQFGLTQGVPNQPENLGASHGEVLTGPKNQDWANTHSSWVMKWTNRYSHTLSDDLVHLHYPLEIYMHWYRAAFGDHLQLSNLVFE